MTIGSGMTQADIQKMRRVIAAQITALHDEKATAKGYINKYWVASTPDHKDGRLSFHYLNKHKDYFRSLSKKIASLAALIKTLKKAERAL